MLNTKHRPDECEVCAAQVEADEVGAVPTAGHNEDASELNHTFELSEAGR